MKIDPHDIACRDAVEMVTAYFEGALTDADSEALELHMVICPPCRFYVRSMRSTIERTRALGEPAPMEASAMTELLAALARSRKR